jgi:hypothetical protein
MNRFLISLSAVGLGLAISVAQGKEHDRGNHRTSSVPSNDRSHETATKAPSNNSKPTNVISTAKPSTVIPGSTTKVTPFTPKVGSEGFKSDMISKNNSRTKYFAEHKVDSKYPEKFGKTFKYKVNGEAKTAYCYPGKHHHHWDYRCWNGHYHCWFYWDPCTVCFYYWYPTCNCWAPASCSPSDVPDYSGDSADGPDSLGDDAPPPPDEARENLPEPPVDPVYLL